MQPVDAPDASDNAVVDALRNGAEVREALDRLAGLAARITDSPTAVVMIVGTDRQFVIGSGGPKERPAQDFEEPIAYSLCRQVVLTSEPFVVTDATTDPRAADNPSVTEKGLGAYAGMPLRNDAGRVVGTLCVYDFVTRDWTSDQLDSLADLAEAASTQLAFAEVAGQRERAHRDLEAATAFQHAVFDNLAEGVVACDADGHLAYFNRTLREMHGQVDVESGDTEWADAYALYAPDGERLLAPEEIPLARAYAGETVQDLHMVVRPRGLEPRHFSASGGPIVGADGAKLGAVVAMRDITREARQQRLRTAELDIANALAAGDDDVETTVAVLAHVRDALHLTTSEYLELDDAHRRTDGIVGAARHGHSAHAELPGRPGTVDFALPVTTGGGVGGVLRLAGAADELLDDLGSSFLGTVTAMLARWREQQRILALQAELAAARAVLGRLVEQIDDFVFSAEYRGDGTTRTHFSSNSKGILGGDVGDELDWDAFRAQRIPVEDHPEIDAYRAELAAGRPAEMTVRIRGFDDRIRWVWVRARPRVEGGRRLVDGIASDVTERQQLAVERESLLRDRQRQVADLQALDRAKDEFVATVAHEIRGPLGLLVTFAENVAQEVQGDPDATRKARLVVSNATHLQQVVENIFDLARLDAGVALHPSRVRLCPTVRELGEQYRQMAGERGVSVDVELGPGCSTADDPDGVGWVLADPSRLRQALENLVSNAVKFTPRGGTVQLTCGVEDEQAVVRVSDTGIGIPAEDIGQLFARFYRASNAHSGDTPGTGLGLAVTRSVVEGHGGTVEVESRTSGPHTGTTFTVRLPLHS